MSEVYVSIDIEADGPIPGVNSMLQLGAVAFDQQGKEIGDFRVNICPLAEAKPDPDTLKWWTEKHPDVYAALAKNAVAPASAMIEFRNWSLRMSQKPTLVGYPVSYDFMFVHWYLHRFCDSSPFSHSARDIKTMAADLLGIPYRDATKRNMPRRWFEGLPKHTHNALDDAREQGMLFFRIKKELDEMRNGRLPSQT